VARVTLVNRKGNAMFDVKKSAQVAGVLLSLSPDKSLDRIKLMKLMYLVDRQSFIQYGATVSGDRLVSLPHGPGLSETLSALQGNLAYLADFSRWVVIPQGSHEHSLLKGTELENADLLSEADIEVIENVWKEFGHMENWELVDWTHDSRNCPEWQNPGRSSNTITLDGLSLALGIDSDESSKLQSQNIEVEGIRQSFAEL